MAAPTRVYLCAVYVRRVFFAANDADSRLLLRSERATHLDNEKKTKKKKQKTFFARLRGLTFAGAWSRFAQ